MTVRLTLPREIERRLRAEVRAGRHASLEDAILDRIQQSQDIELLEIQRQAKSKSFAQIMDPVRSAAGRVDEQEIVRLVDRARGHKRSAKRSNASRR
jgi:hypothetical protein